MHGGLLSMGYLSGGVCQGIFVWGYLSGGICPEGIFREIRHFKERNEKVFLSVISLFNVLVMDKLLYNNGFSLSIYTIFQYLLCEKMNLS